MYSRGSNVYVAMDFGHIFLRAGSITHSVTQSSFESPCNLLNENGGGQLGFDSSLQQDAEFSLVITNASRELLLFLCHLFFNTLDRANLVLLQAVRTS